MLKSLFECTSFKLGAMLKMESAGTSSRSDIDIFFEKGTKGGISDISNRYNKANNK